MSSKKSFSTETSERYSRALFEVANETSDLKKIESDVVNLSTLMNSSVELSNFLINDVLFSSYICSLI